MQSAEIIEAFKGKILGVSNYDSRVFLVSDFIDFDSLFEYLVELSEHECDITPAGISFLKHYYGWQLLAEKLRLNSRFDPSHGELTVHSIEQWFRDLKPMEIIIFVSEAQGTLKGEPKWKDEVLPPSGY